jgi:elongation factor 1 alpha-like protein
VLLHSLTFFSSLDQPVRIILSDVYAEGKGVAARGRVVQGFLQVGEKVVVLPIADEATVSQIEHLHALETPELHQYAVVGQTVDLTLTGIDAVRVSTGSILTRTDLTARPSIARKLQAKLAVMDELTIPIIRGALVLFHIQNLDVPAVVTQLISTTKRSQPRETRNRPRAITAASSAVVEITLSNPICIEPFHQCRTLGRFVLRRSGDTIAVGVIEEVFSSC